MDSDGSVRQVLPDGVTAAALHHQFIGNFQGLTELSRLVEARLAELEAIIKQQELDNQTTK